METYVDKLRQTPPMPRPGNKPQPFSREGYSTLYDPPDGLSQLPAPHNNPMLTRTLTQQRDEAGGKHGRHTSMFRSRYDDMKISHVTEQPVVHGMAGAGKIGNESYLTGHPQDKLVDGLPLAGHFHPVDNFTAMKHEAYPHGHVEGAAIRAELHKPLQRPTRSGRGHGAYNQ